MGLDRIRLIVSLLLMPAAISAQPSGFNYEEEKVPDYTLPELLRAEDGTVIDSFEAWEKKRRPEILALFEKFVYGVSPDRPRAMRFLVLEEDDQALGGQALRRQVRVFFTADKESPSMDILIYAPNDAAGPVPLFLGLNFYGNHTVHEDPKIVLSDRWMRPSEEKAIVNNRATEESRGKSASRWAIEAMLEKGYALATIYCGDIDPDFHDEFQNGVHALDTEDGRERTRHSWGTISAWAWGLSRAVDYVETDPDLDAGRVAVIGHSRLGKTALWAGAVDTRFKLVISNNSGCGGAALSRRRFGETVDQITSAFPHWFCGQFRSYAGKEEDIPVDQHMLIALAAPRAVYVASAVEDRWADPKGEFLSAKHAQPVFDLYDLKGVGVSELPELNHPVGETVGYHLRSGEHEVKAYDWAQYLAFADRHLK